MGFEKMVINDEFTPLSDATFTTGDVKTLREWLGVNFKGMTMKITSPREDGWMSLPIDASGDISFTRHGNLVRMHMRWKYLDSGVICEELVFFDPEIGYKLELARGELQLARLGNSCCALI